MRVGEGDATLLPSPGVKSTFVFSPTISLLGMELSQSAGVRDQQAAEASVHGTSRVEC